MALNPRQAIDDLAGCVGAVVVMVGAMRVRVVRMGLIDSLVTIR
jgi:hypothetical protein